MGTIAILIQETWRYLATNRAGTSGARPIQISYRMHMGLVASRTAPLLRACLAARFAGWIQNKSAVRKTLFTTMRLIRA